MSPSWESYNFASSCAATRDEAAGAAASSLGSATSFGGLRYTHIREHGNDGDSSELGSEHGNGRRSQETEDLYDLHCDEEPAEDDEERGTTGGRTTNEPLNCPYRKRNKERFNIRDHAKCTNPFKEFSHLKSVPLEIPRQKCLWPLTQQEGHVDDVEDGITEDIDNLLIARKNRHKVSNWEGLWKTLFPYDTVVPSPVYEPCIQAAVDEFPAIAKKAISGSYDAQVCLVFGRFESSRTQLAKGLGLCPVPSALGQRSRIVAGTEAIVTWLKGDAQSEPHPFLATN
ncbi:hypothetical protein B0I37DRAFT_404461 [Chaetomium sp. MPI-CAGE-AT-0009]|nr:hypothetical protein B0I37DRAFT_404461 [Chaetomium sp. MPI-CAGE-AT-0009]